MAKATCEVKEDVSRLKTLQKFRKAKHVVVRFQYSVKSILQIRSNGQLILNLDEIYSTWIH